MASNSTKSFLADAGYGEQELDANSALMELDKGIGKSGLSGRNARGGNWRHPVAGASGEAGTTHARRFAGRGVQVVSLGRGLWLLREVAGKLQDYEIGFTPVEQVAGSSGGPVFTT
jgi:hypothetical protein